MRIPPNPAAGSAARASVGIPWRQRGLLLSWASSSSLRATSRRALSIARARPRSSDRGRRLGLPLLFGTFAIVPIMGSAHLALNPAVPPVSYWTYLTKYFPPQGPLHRYFLGDVPKPGFWPERELWPPFNFGHLWFLEHLLVYALLYAAVRAVIPADRGSAARNAPTHGAIAAYAVLLAAATFVIRIWYPQDRWIGFLGFIQMEPAHIPQYASLFVIGVLAGPWRWIETVPTRRGLAWLAVGVGLAALAYLWAAFATVRGPELPELVDVRLGGLPLRRVLRRAACRVPRAGDRNWPGVARSRRQRACGVCLPHADRHATAMGPDRCDWDRTGCASS